MEAANTEYLTLATTFTIEEIAQETQRVGSLRGQKYRIQVDFVVQPTREALRQERNTPKPITHGPTTAKVVGPEGQNIWTDGAFAERPCESSGNNFSEQTGTTLVT